MADRQVGLGTLVKVDHDGDLTYTTVGLIKNATPPPRVRTGVEGTVLADTLATEEAGIEEVSEFTFMQTWHPTDTNHEILDTLFGSKDKVNWQVIYPFSTPVTDQFTGWVKALEPEEITEDGMISRQVTVSRTSAITRS